MKITKRRVAAAAISVSLLGGLGVAQAGIPTIADGDGFGFGAGNADGDLFAFAGRSSDGNDDFGIVAFNTEDGLFIGRADDDGVNVSGNECNADGQLDMVGAGTFVSFGFGGVDDEEDGLFAATFEDDTIDSANIAIGPLLVPATVAGGDVDSGFVVINSDDDCVTTTVD